VIYEEEAIYSI